MIVVGAGASLGRLKDEARDLGGSIEFLGFRRDVPDLLRACDALVSPTRYEAYGLNVHEALCCGLPALVSRSAGVAERYPAGLADLLIPDPDDPADLPTACGSGAITAPGSRRRPLRSPTGSGRTPGTTWRPGSSKSSAGRRSSAAVRGSPAGAGSVKIGRSQRPAGMSPAFAKRGDSTCLTLLLPPGPGTARTRPPKPPAGAARDAEVGLPGVVRRRAGADDGDAVRAGDQPGPPAPPGRVVRDRPGVLGVDRLARPVGRSEHVPRAALADLLHRLAGPPGRTPQLVFDPRGGLPGDLVRRGPFRPHSGSARSSRRPASSPG